MASHPRDPGIIKRTAEEIYKLNITNRALAKKLGCHEQTVAGWVAQECVPSAYFLQRLHYLGCDVMYILTGERSHVRHLSN